MLLVFEVIRQLGKHKGLIALFEAVKYLLLYLFPLFFSINFLRLIIIVHIDKLAYHGLIYLQQRLRIRLYDLDNLW